MDIDLGNDSETIFLVTPQIIVHPIDEDSVSKSFYIKSEPDLSHFTKSALMIFMEMDGRLLLYSKVCLAIVIIQGICLKVARLGSLSAQLRSTSGTHPY